MNTKHEQHQAKLPRAKWDDAEADNSWRFKYLGSIFQADGKQMPDVKCRIAMVRTRFGRLRHVWEAGCLHLNLKLRLYKSAVCSILTYGSEAWFLTEQVRKALNGANSRMVAIITGKTPKEEAGKDKTFDVV